MRIVFIIIFVFCCAVMHAENILVRDAPTLSVAWIGSAITAGASLIGGLIDNKSQNKNIDKQIAVQKEENQKNRDYNLMLAQKQNAWNVEQWERENAYNDPQAQLDRMRKAGINPDLAVGGGYQNTAASSPAMTAGAASTAQDMSILGQRPTLGQAIQSALHDSMLGAQIDNIKANTKKTLADAGISETQLKYADVKEKLGIDISQQQYDNLKEEFNNLFELGRKYALENEGIAYDNVMKKIDSELYSKKAHTELRQLEESLKISENEAEYLVKTMAARILGVESDAQLKKYESEVNSPELIKKLPEGIKPLVSLLNLVFRGR